MQRLAPRRHFLRLRRARGYATSGLEDAAAVAGAAVTAQALKGSRKRSGKIKQPQLSSTASNSPYEPKLEKPAAGSLADALLKETASGKSAADELQAKIAEATARRRAARLAKESTGESAPSPSGETAQSRRSQHRVRLGQPFDSTPADGQAQGQFPRRRFNNNNNNRAGGSGYDNWRPQRQFGARNQNNNRPRPGSSNKPPPPKQALEQTATELEEASLVVELQEPNSTGPLPIMNEFTSILPKTDETHLEKALAHVSGLKGPNPKVVGHILRRFGGDYSGTVPTHTPGLYTTPVNKLPILTQLALASAKSRKFEKNERLILQKTVTKAVGSIATTA